MRSDSKRKLQALCAACLCAAVLALVSGCKDDMKDRGRLKTYEASKFFSDGLSSRPLVPGTVTRTGYRSKENPLYTGRDADGKLLNAFPIEVTEETLRRGQQQFNIFCSVCHGMTGGEISDPINGKGNGMIVARGFTPPPSLHLARLQTVPVGHFFDVVSNGWGAMYSYAERIAPEDRWAIVAYVKTLQLSQRVDEALLNSEDRSKLEESQKIAMPTDPRAQGDPTGH